MSDTIVRFATRLEALQGAKAAGFATYLDGQRYFAVRPENHNVKFRLSLDGPFVWERD